jgi:hypothetical protein
LEEEEQAGHAQQQGAGDLLSDAEGSVAYEAGIEAAMPIVDLYSVRGRCIVRRMRQWFTRVVRALQRVAEGLFSNSKRDCAGLAAGYATLP